MIVSLNAENISCARGQRLLFADLSFQVEQGRTLAIQGANGAGKTSLLRLLAGFLAPVSGRVCFAAKGESEISEPEERGKQIGWLGHHDGLKGQLTVAEQLAFFGRLYGHPLRPSQLDAATATSPASASRAGEADLYGPPRSHAVATNPSQLDAVLEQVGLARQSELPCRYLSAGQKKRLALARLKLTNRPIWLMDEPLAALDLAGKHLAAEMIAAHCAWGGIVLAATHEPLGVPAAASLTLGEA
jgi:heme exporter protein A